MRLPAKPATVFAPIVAIALAFTIAGCENKVDVKNETVSGVAKKVADANLRFNPGRWESTVKFMKIDMEGVPPEAKAMMEKVMAKDRTFDSCLTKEEAEKPEGKFFGQADDRCKYDNFTMGGGKIDAKMTCKAEQGEQVMTMTGTYTPDTYAMTMTVAGKGMNNRPMNMTMSVSARRAGECTGKEVS